MKGIRPGESDTIGDVLHHKAEEELQAELRAAKAGKREKVDKDW